MSPAPFLSRFIVGWLAAQATSRVQETVVDELKTRIASGNLGDLGGLENYDGLLFKGKKGADEANSENSGTNVGLERVDVGVVGSTKRELVGILDKMGVPKTTKGGDSLTFYAGSWLGLRIAAVEAGVGAAQTRKGAEALIQAFRPIRVVSIGFATGLTPTLKSGALVVPSRFFRANGSALDWGTAVGEEETAESAASGRGASPFERWASGALQSGKRTLVEPSEKRSLGEATGAAIYDRGTWPTAEVCVARDVPFLPLRVVLDACDEVAPRDVRNVVSDSQSAARLLGAFFGAVSKRPGAALDLYKAKERALVAADKLASALETILKAGV
jgi:nucleoside phosphorylase